MSRRLVRLIVSAIAAAGIAGGGAIATAVTATSAPPSEAVLWLAVSLAITALCKDVQSSLSEPPTMEGKESERVHP